MAKARRSRRAQASAEVYADVLDASVTGTPSPEPVPVPADEPAVAAGRRVEPKRDCRGRFKRAGGRMKRIGRPRSGRRGPSYLANKRQEALVRTCIVAEHEVGRLEAELARDEWSDPTRIVLARMSGIRKLQRDGQRRRIDALSAVLVDMAEARIPRDQPKRHEEIAERVSKKLGEHFSWRTLYNRPYRTAWRSIDDALAAHAADHAATLAERSRLSKPMLVYKILKMNARRDELLEQLRGRLLADTADEEGWDPIPRRRSPKDGS